MIDDHEPKRILPVKKITHGLLVLIALYAFCLTMDFYAWIKLRGLYDDIEATRLNESLPDGWEFISQQGRTFDVRTSPQSTSLCYLIGKPMLGPARTFVTLLQPFTYMTPTPERLLHVELDYDRAGGYPCGRGARGELIMILKLGVEP